MNISEQDLGLNKQLRPQNQKRVLNAIQNQSYNKSIEFKHWISMPFKMQLHCISPNPQDTRITAWGSFAKDKSFPEKLCSNFGWWPMHQPFMKSRPLCSGPSVYLVCVTDEREVEDQSRESSCFSNRALVKAIVEALKCLQILCFWDLEIGLS